MENSVDDRLKKLSDKGVIIVDPRQTYVSADVDLDRIYGGCALHPGTRLTGSRTLIGTGAIIGAEGPAVVEDSIIGPAAEVASGFLSGAVMLPGARAGANSHFRAGTLLEEDASTAHSVGLKQTILMHSVTLGSLINFCDVLISGGRSRGEHTEVGSGFIHFNYSPWGKNGNKATPSLIGNVTDGVFLDSDRIFLGGLSGIAGPVSIGFGALTGAGQVIRESVGESTMHSEASREIDKKMPLSEYRLSERQINNIRSKNVEYIAQLYALKGWYSQIRQKRSAAVGDAEMSLVLEGAVETIKDCIRERIQRFNGFAKEWSSPAIDGLTPDDGFPALTALPDLKPALTHTEWVKSLSEKEKRDLREWLESRPFTLSSPAP